MWKDLNVRTLQEARKFYAECPTDTNQKNVLTEIVETDTKNAMTRQTMKEITGIFISWF